MQVVRKVESAVERDLKMTGSGRPPGASITVLAKQYGQVLVLPLLFEETTILCLGSAEADGVHPECYSKRRRSPFHPAPCLVHMALVLARTIARCVR